MSERMTDEAAERHDRAILAAGWKDWLRARRVEQEQAEALKTKDATIEALADALWDSGDEYPEVGWHTATCVMDGVGIGKGCSTLCAARRSALRLAGRLP